MALLPGDRGTTYMRLAGFLLLLAGWGIVLAAIALLAPALARTCFLFAGVGVEALGIVLVIRLLSACCGKAGLNRDDLSCPLGNHRRIM